MIIDDGVARGIASIEATLAGAGHLLVRFDQPATEIQAPVLDLVSSKPSSEAEGTGGRR